MVYPLDPWPFKQGLYPLHIWPAKPFKNVATLKEIALSSKLKRTVASFSPHPAKVPSLELV